MQHQKEKNACDVSWKPKMAQLNGENVSLNIQLKSLVQENERIKLEFQKLFNSIKATRVQHQQEVNELIEHVNQNTYACGDVRVASSSNVRRLETKDTNLKKRVLLSQEKSKKR
ncbi:hypothetical protein Tco_0374188 [Tanacetum coccineum]